MSTATVTTQADLSEATGLNDKIKARSCRVVREVDIDGKPLGGARGDVR